MYGSVFAIKRGRWRSVNGRVMSWCSAGSPLHKGAQQKDGSEGYLLALVNDQMRQRDKYNCLLGAWNRRSGKGYTQAANHNLKLN